MKSRYIGDFKNLVWWKDDDDDLNGIQMGNILEDGDFNRLKMMI